MGEKANEQKSKESTVECPTCGEPVAESVDTFPFCTQRCRQIDLGKWLKGDYRISRPVEQADLDQGE
ncbi:MAG: DNA gyrase inhibitor YacG [Phycisphaeraceae bacterium]|nr:DNA gyrase inhibitor YacG [Phycisphaeraceae bacterium]